MPLPPHPLLVVSYSDETRAALTASLVNNNVAAVACSTFCEAENLVLQGLFNGILIELPSIIKAKGEEKIVAYTLTNFFPTLRVRAVGSVLIPMAMPGSAKQDKNLNDFINVTCSNFIPRKLRTFRRHQLFLPTLLSYQDQEYRGFTMNMSWGGAFIVDVFAEKFTEKSEIKITFPEFDFCVDAIICWSRIWGSQNPPGIGVKFQDLTESDEEIISKLLKSRKEFDRDRLVS